MLRCLSANHEVYLFALSEEELAFDIKEHLLAFCKEVHCFKQSPTNSMMQALKGFIMNRPLQAGYFYNSRLHQSLIAFSNNVRPDVIFFQLVRTAEYARHLNARVKVIDYMDTFSAGYKRMSQKTSGIQRFIYSLEAKRLAQYESEIFTRFDKHLIISEQDRQEIQHPSKSSIQIIPNGVDLSYFKHDQHGKKYALLFHGNMNYLPNVDCALYIANEILPLLHKRNRNLTLLISGASPQKKVRQLSSRTGITVTGWLDDVRTAYAASQIFIAPLQMGTGIQNKILEAIAMQLPCVVSPLAADALMLQHGEHVLIGKTPDEYCDHIERLTADPQLRLYLTTKAYQYIQTQFIWEDSVYKLANFISSN